MPEDTSAKVHGEYRTAPKERAVEGVKISGRASTDLSVVLATVLKLKTLSLVKS